MPISSGAAANNNQGSYLKMYLGTLPQEKRMILENSLEAEHTSSAEQEEGQKDEQEEDVEQEIHTDQSSEGHPNGGHANGGHANSGHANGEQSPKKSSTCSLL